MTKYPNTQGIQKVRNPKPVSPAHALCGHSPIRVTAIRVRQKTKTIPRPSSRPFSHLRILLGSADFSNWESREGSIKIFCLTPQSGAVKGPPLVPAQIDLNAHGLAVYTLDDVALEGIHGLEVFGFHTPSQAAFRGFVTPKFGLSGPAKLKESQKNELFK